VDLSPGGLGRLADGRVLLRQPPADRHGILLEGPPPGFLGREAPAFQVAADGPNRHLEPTPVHEELLDCLPGPEGEGQAELVGAAAQDEPDDQRGLVGGEARRPAAGPGAWPSAPSRRPGGTRSPSG
jgi:hypothetical protein